LSHRRRTSGQGVIDGNPIAIILICYMFLVLVFWFQSTSSVNPIAGNSTIRQAYVTGYSGIRWFALLLAPFTIFLFARGFVGEGSVFRKHGESDSEESGEEEEE